MDVDRRKSQDALKQLTTDDAAKAGDIERLKGELDLFKIDCTNKEREIRAKDGEIKRLVGELAGLKRVKAESVEKVSFLEAHVAH